MCIGIERNTLEKINTGISLLKINSYIDCIIKKENMYSLDFVGFKLEFNSLNELVKYCQMTFVDPYEYVTKDGKSIGVKVKEFYTKD
jgi:hypothetical protein